MSRDQFDPAWIDTELDRSKRELLRMAKLFFRLGKVDDARKILATYNSIRDYAVDETKEELESEEVREEV